VYKKYAEKYIHGVQVYILIIVKKDGFWNTMCKIVS